MSNELMFGVFGLIALLVSALSYPLICAKIVLGVILGWFLPGALGAFVIELDEWAQSRDQRFDWDYVRRASAGGLLMFLVGLGFVTVIPVVSWFVRAKEAAA